jgi:hypothetical protein
MSAGINYAEMRAVVQRSKARGWLGLAALTAPREGHVAKELWETVDWSETLQQIASRLQCSPACVWKQKRKRGLVVPRAPQPSTLNSQPSAL